MSEVVARYGHPQGSVITVFADGSLVKVNPAGKVVSTSATVAKLAVGHGGWTPLTGDAPAATPPAPRNAAAPSGTPRLPMKFQQAEVADLPRYVNDDAWVLQQKVDGIRAQLVMEGGVAPWFRNGTGGLLVSSTAAATTGPLLAKLPHHPEGAPGYTVDGEVLNGVFHAFDLVADDRPDATLAERLATLAIWFDAVVDNGLGDRIRLLPTARDTEAKLALAEAVYNGGGEGWIAKRLDSRYEWGARVTHSLKLKVTHTVDCIVVARNVDGKSNMVLALLQEGTGALTEVGAASAIGKPDAQVGDVVEVKYLYTGADGRLVQPTVLRLRADKPAAECYTGQLRFANKAVVTP